MRARVPAPPLAIQSLVVVVLSLAIGLSIQRAPVTARATHMAEGQPTITPEAACPVTPYAPRSPALEPNSATVVPEVRSEDDAPVWYGGDSLWIGLDPAQAGEWFAGAEGNQIRWLGPDGTEPSIEASRLDGPGSTVRAEIVGPAADWRGEITHLVFPTEGWWELIARVGGDELRLVVYVHPADEHPLHEVDGSPRPRAPRAPGPSFWASLRRPLDLPLIEAGGPCPRTEGERVSPTFGPAAGSGPVYAVSLGPDGVLHFDPDLPDAEGWRWHKVMLISAPAYEGPILVRGRRLDGPGALRLASEFAADPPGEIRLVGGVDVGPFAPGWRSWASGAGIRAAGCYAYQVDGWNFSDTVIFQASLELPDAVTPLPAMADLPLDLYVHSALRTDHDHVRLALLSVRGLTVRVDLAPSEAIPPILPGGAQRLDTAAGVVLWEADPDQGWPRLAAWDDGRRRYRLEVLDLTPPPVTPEAGYPGGPGEWSVDALTALVEAFVAAGDATPPSAGG